MSETKVLNPQEVLNAVQAVLEEEKKLGNLSLVYRVWMDDSYTHGNTFRSVMLVREEAIRAVVKSGRIIKLDGETIGRMFGYPVLISRRDSKGNILICGSFREPGTSLSDPSEAKLDVSKYGYMCKAYDVWKDGEDPIGVARAIEQAYKEYHEVVHSLFVETIA
jgi:hypothetical protein